MDPRCTMGLAILIFVTVLSISDAVSVETQAYFNGTAYSPCPFTKAQNISSSESVVFWQDQQKLVSYEHYLGTEKLDSVNAKYSGRTSFDRNNWTLRLHNVQIKDMGSYDCFIQKKPPTGSIILQQTLTESSVIANFSEPEIKSAQNVTGNSGINLTCTSKQGHPKPKKMYFSITNSTNEYGDNMQISQDNVTESFSISNSLSLSFPDGVWHMTVVCVSETESMKISSKPLNFTQEFPSPQTYWKEITASVTVALLLVMSLIIVCHKKPNQPSRPSNTASKLERDSNADRETINSKELEPQIASAKPNAE